MISNTTKRLRLLSKSKLLDSPPEEAFDRFTRMIVRLLDVPMALVTLVDKDRQFFKSAYGLPDPWAARRQTPLSHSLCRYVVDSSQPLIVTDTRDVPLLQENPAISELGMVAYLGFPLMVEGQALGSFCAADTRPHAWSQQDVNVVQELAHLVDEELARRVVVVDAQPAFSPEENCQPSQEQENLFPDIKNYVESILEHMSDAFWHLDAQYRILYMNRRAEWYSNINRKEALGQEIWKVAPSLLWTPCEPHLRRAMETRQEMEFNVLSPRLRRWVDVQASPTAHGLCLYFHDIHERKQAEKALRTREQLFRRLMDSNLLGIAIIDAQGTVCEANDAFLTLPGYTQEDVAARRLQWSALFPPEYQEQAIKILEELRATGTFSVQEKAYVRKDGTRVPVQIGGTLVIREGAEPSILCFVLDLTARKEIERQKDHMLSMTGYELKTPLAALKGMLQLTQRRMKRIKNDEEYLSPVVSTFFDSLARSVEEALRQIDVQTHLINDLLDVLRITSGTLQLELELCDLAALLRESVQDMRATAPERSLILELSEPQEIIVYADRERIRRVISNYITNAIRYSPTDQPIHIGLTLLDHTVCVSVRDQGPVLTEEAQIHLRQRFCQITGVPTQCGSGKGQGLGLYICRTLIAHHHGEVGVESAPEKGSTFWFTLPLPDLRHAEALTIETDIPASSGIAACDLHGPQHGALLEQGNLALEQARLAEGDANAPSSSSPLRRHIMVPPARGQGEDLQANAVTLFVQTGRMLAALLQEYDESTRTHCARISCLAEETGRQLGASSEDLFLMKLGGFCHDLGKIGIPNAILQKPGALIDEEWHVMQLHSEISAYILGNLGGFFQSVAPVVQAHHERWNGQGYPRGLRGEAIPLASRVIAVVDAYDTMMSRRSYKEQTPASTVEAELRRNAGTQFDPVVVYAFLDVLKRPDFDWRHLNTNLDWDTLVQEYAHLFRRGPEHSPGNVVQHLEMA